MLTRFFLPLALLPAMLAGQVPAPPTHQPNFDAERKQADELFLAKKFLDALPLYEDLCKQDQTIAVFAERHAISLITKGATLPNGPEQSALQQQAFAELRRAQSLGDNSPLVQNMFDILAKTPIGAILSGIPLTVGYTYQGSPAAQAAMQQAGVDFAKNDFPAALKSYERAADLDPAFYSAALYVGDTYFRMNDWPNASLWFQKAIAIDPDRDTAYRYWGDALFKAGDLTQAKLRYEQGFLAEPYGRTALNSLNQWFRLTKTPVGRPPIIRPDFTTPDGKLKVDPALLTETGDGHASWLVYQQARVAHGAHTLSQLIVAGGRDANGQLHPTGYRHSLTEETESLNAMLADLQHKLDAHTVTPDKLEPSLAALLDLQKNGWLACWVLLTAADAGIRYDYPVYRAQHRDLLLAYMDGYLLAKPTPAAAAQPAH